MSKYRLTTFFVMLISSTSIYANFTPLFKTDNKILIYDKENNKSRYIKDVFERHKIKYENVTSIDKNNENLHVIFNSMLLTNESLPKYYICYQDIDLSVIKLTDNYKNKLNSAICVWDYSWSNIEKYSSDIWHYAYFPEEYEYTDPIILPCLLPTQTLDTYRAILRYSNVKNTDISSHLPTIYAISILQNPELIIELGVRTGESSIIFAEYLKYSPKTKLIGVDLEFDSDSVYKNIKNSSFYCMDDIKFPEYWANQNTNQKADIVFIDTSHLYEHTLEEISKYVPLLSEKGLLLFHDSNMSPGFKYSRLNNVTQHGGWDNQKGVFRAICDYFSINFDESRYVDLIFSKNETNWRLVHYPFCNGLTIIKKN